MASKFAAKSWFDTSFARVSAVPRAWSLLDLGGLTSWPTEPPAHDASFGLKFAVARDLGLDRLQAGPHPLPDHAALEFSKGPVIWNSSRPAGVVVSMFC